MSTAVSVFGGKRPAVLSVGTCSLLLHLCHLLRGRGSLKCFVNNYEGKKQHFGMRSGKCCKKREMAKQFTLSLFQIDTGKHLKMTAIQSFVGASDRKCHLYARTLLCWNSVTCSDTAQLRGLNLYGRCLAWTANETISVGTGGKWGGMLGNICRGSCVRRMRNH